MEIKRFKPNKEEIYIKRIKEMLNHSEKYLIKYFDTLKTKIDIQFVETLSRLQNNKKLKEETNKEWIKIIQIIEKCLEKCIKNKLNPEMVTEYKNKIAQIEITYEKQDLEKELHRIKNKLESHLLANDSCLAMFAPKFIENNSKTRVYYDDSSEAESGGDEFEYIPDRIIKKILIVEEGFRPIEIEMLLKDSIMYNNNCIDFNDSNINHIKMIFVLAHLAKENKNLIFIELKLRQMTKLKIDFKNCLESIINSIENPKMVCTRLYYWPESFYCYNSNIQLKDDLLILVNLKELSIGSVDIKNMEVFSNLTNLESLEMIKVNIDYFESKSLVVLTRLIELKLKDCIIKSVNLNAHLQIKSLYLVGNNSLIDSKFLCFDKVEKLVLNKIDLNNFLKEDCFAYVSKIKELKIEDISILNDNVFVCLNNLEMLDLSQSQFWRLDSECFNGLKSLKYLNLGHENKYQVGCNLHKDIFVGLDNLEVLKLNSEYIDFKDACFNGLTNLKELYIKVITSLKNLSATTFVSLNNLIKLEIYNAQMIILNNGFLNGFPKLKVLNFERGKILVKENAFIGLECLEELDFSGAHKFYFQIGCFNSLKNLTYLNLSNQYFEKEMSLNKNYFKDLEKLEKLDLINCDLSIKSEMFYYFKNLKHLNLTKCGIKVLKKGDFAYLSNLETLCLKENSSLHLENDCFSGLISLKRLNLSSCKLKSPKPDANCRIRLEKDCFKDLNNLKWLSLSSCGFKKTKKGSICMLSQLGNA